MAQKSIRVDDRVVDALAEWVSANGYTAQRVFMAGLRAMISVSHEDRAAMFDGCEAWLVDWAENWPDVEERLRLQEREP